MMKAKEVIIRGAKRQDLFNSLLPMRAWMQAAGT